MSKLDSLNNVRGGLWIGIFVFVFVMIPFQFYGPTASTFQYTYQLPPTSPGIYI